jgi:uncharacterized protein
MNPFVIKGYLGTQYFCDRETETEKMVSSIRNSQDITLFAIRRIGKSALIHHVFDQLNESFDGIYVDLWGTTSLSGFMRETANSVLQSSIFSTRSFSKKLADFIRSIGASLSIGYDGKPSIEIMYHDRNVVFNNLEEIFRFLEAHSRPVILAFDEFQEIRNYNDNMPLEARLRGLVQRFHNIRFIFSGSEQHLIADIFSSTDRPFFQSTRMIELTRILPEKYHDFITGHFRKGRKTIPDELVYHILTVCHLHTYYVQAVCNMLYARSRVPETIDQFEEVFRDFIAEKKVFYAELPVRLTRHQFNTVKAIADRGKVDGVTTREFMEQAGIGSPGSMQAVIRALLDKQMIIKEEDSYRLYDVFLEHYLRYFTNS